MAQRTFAIGDIHGETTHLFRLLGCLPPLDDDDTLVFLGDYLDRGPNSMQVVRYLMQLPKQTPAKVITLRGNHEDAWLRVLESGWDAFVKPPGNGCLAAYRSFVGGPVPGDDELPRPEEAMMIETGAFIPDDIVIWLQQLPFWYEDDHAIYVHAGVPRRKAGSGDEGPTGGFEHPRDVEPKTALLWLRDEDFFRNYRGKPIVFGHTRTEYLPPELSGYTPDDPTDLWAGEAVVGIDTGCGNGGFLTAYELPSGRVYESRD